MRIVIEIEDGAGQAVHLDTATATDTAPALDAGPAPATSAATTLTTTEHAAGEAIDAGPAGTPAANDDTESLSGVSEVIDAGAAPDL